MSEMNECVVAHGVHLDAVVQADASGEWSHLAVFPEVFRGRVARRLGLRPTVEEYAQAWEFCGFKQPKTRGVKFAAVLGQEDLYVVASERDWPDGASVDGDVTELMLMPVGGRVMGLDLPLGDESELIADGWCYTEFGHELRDVVGCPWPTVAQLCAAGVNRAVIQGNVSMVSTGVFHVEKGGGDVVVRDCDIVGGFDLPSVSVFEQLQQQPDFTACKCRVHVAPRFNYAGRVVGCGLKKVGYAEPVRAAAEGRNRFCHAEPSVRELDRQLLELVHRDSSGLRSFESAGVLPEVDKFQSDNDASVDAFGRGYCYLQPVHARLRWRVARQLGPNPLCSDVLKVWKKTMKSKFKCLAIVEVSPGWFHLAVDKGSKGVSDSAGRQLYSALESVSSSVMTARIGADSTGQGSTVGGDSTRYVCSEMEVIAQATKDSERDGDYAAFESALRLAMRSQAMHNSEDKKRLRMLAALGDSVLTLIVCERTYKRGGDVQAYQERRSMVTKNEFLAARFRDKSRLVGEFICVGEITAKVGGEALEALLGVMLVYRGYDATVEFAKWFGV